MKTLSDFQRQLLLKAHAHHTTEGREIAHWRVGIKAHFQQAPSEVSGKEAIIDGFTETTWLNCDAMTGACNSVSRTKEKLDQYLKSHQIGSEIYYPLPLHLQECFQDLGYQAGDFPSSETAAKETLALPIYPELTESMQRSVVAAIVDFYTGSVA